MTEELVGMDDLLDAVEQLSVVATEAFDACALARRVLASTQPDDCWSIDPSTGELVQNTVICSSCSAIAAIDTVLDKAHGKG